MVTVPASICLLSAVIYCCFVFVNVYVEPQEIVFS